ncbi:hypothetical protein OG883_22650 [Streptomyces sp. NBC_01142]|uniref:hypothetical protein n=1 Tax=Streptomyces sp. NBC_01142 TaxID=2975865 RepID=UPI0022525CDA|nr:hypothetical protein [Streptomyces sp. NBC_01142]MCX4822646.1 hypothetical protein [Streptomyces sp. NBC_01142]
MNWHRSLMLLAAPLFASSVALTPALAAPVASAGAGAASAARPALFCELVPSESGEPDGDTTYDLLLSGFAPRQSVKIEGPRTNFQARVDDQGKSDEKDVRYGKYSVSYKESGAKQGKRIGCVTPPREKPGGGKQKVKVTKVEVITLTKPGTVVDCTKPNKVEFDGKITGVGKGDVDYHWTFASSADPVDAGKVTFTLGTTQSHSILRVVEVPRAGNPTNSLSVFTTLHVPSQNLSARSEQVQLTCAKP